MKAEAYILTEDQDVGCLSRQEGYACIKDGYILLLYLEGLK